MWTTGYKDLMKLSYRGGSDLTYLKLRSLDCSVDGRRLILGTFDSEIIEMTTNDLVVSQNSKYIKADINKGPFTPDSVDRYEMWGLAVFRSPEKADLFLTCSDNGLVELWSASAFKRLRSISLHSSDTNSEHNKPDDSKLRCMAISGGEDILLVGCRSGLIQVINLEEMQIMLSIKESIGCINEIKYAPNDQRFSVGTSSRALDIYTTQDYKRKANLKNPVGPINHMDWAIDSKWIQATSNSSNLLYYDATQLALIPNISKMESIRNEEWSSLTCDLGWSVQGIWKQKDKKPQQVVTVDRSNAQFFKEYPIIAVGEEDGKVKLYKYPCVQPTASSVESRGHSSFISNLKWTADDRYLISTGGLDQTIIIWEVEKLS